MTYRLLLILTLSLLVLCVPSCQPSNEPHSLFENYRYRLQNSLKLDLKNSLKLDFRNNLKPEDSLAKAKALQSELMRYPSVRDMSYAITSSNINLLDFLKLSSCDLQRHIGQRNSSLGRFMKNSQALLYEYKFLRLAHQCLSQLDPESDLYTILLQAVLLKEKQLPAVQWNAVFASEEFATLFSLGTKPLSMDELRMPPLNLYAAFDTLALFLNKQLEDSASAEQAYAVIASSKRIGELRLSMQVAKKYLEQTDQLLQYRIKDKPLCFKQRANSQFEVVNTVFFKFYIGEVQPYIALLHQQTKTLFTKVDELVSASEPTPIFSNFWDGVYKKSDSEWQGFDRAIESHTKNWQALLMQCGRMPN